MRRMLTQLKSKLPMFLVALVAFAIGAHADLPTRRVTITAPHLFKNSVTVEGTLTASGNSAVTGNQTVTGDSTITGDLTVSGNDVVLGGTAAAGIFRSATADAVTSASVPGVALKCADITATDACGCIEDSTGACVLKVLENGNGSVTGSFAAPGGVAIGSSGTNIVKVASAVTAAIDIGSASANAAVTADATVSGAALGNHCLIAPVEDDAAWDEGTLTCFVEGSNDVKIVYQADDSGGNPGASNTYRITLIQF